MRGERVPADRIPELPAGYDEASTAIARRRIAQAGYRMGEHLNRLLDPAYTPKAPAPATAPQERDDLLVPRLDRVR